MPKKRKQKGLSVVEFTIVAIVFFALFFTVVDIALYGYVKLTMQNAVREGARYAITGQLYDSTDTAVRDAAIKAEIDDASNGLLTKVMDITDIRVQDINGTSLPGFGGPGDIIAIHLDYEWPILSPLLLPFGDKYAFTVSAAMKNEEF